jgi:hypothetical protein
MTETKFQNVNLFIKEIVASKVKNNIVRVNLTGHNLSDEQIDVLKLGLRHGFATRPIELEMLSVAEDIWDQIARLDQFKDGNFVNDKLKNSLRSFT